MSIDRAGLPFIGGALALAGVVAWAASWAWALPCVFLAAFFAFFFRDPHREVPPVVHEVLSPADGRVMVAGAAEPGVAPSGDWQQISIFLSPMDVHVNRIPVSGRVTRVEYRPGKFLPAYKAASALENERNEIWIVHGRQTIVCRQVVGILARRIVARLSTGAQVTAGQRFGIMKFGSRMDVFVPPGATVTAKVGDRVWGGETVLATLRDDSPDGG